MPRIHPPLERPIRVGALVGAVLAGGEGRRLGPGIEKPFRRLHGKPLIEHTLERLRPQVAAIVVSAHGDAARFARLGVPVVTDTIGPDPDGRRPGPLAGVLAAMTWARQHHPFSPWLLTVPVDVPFLPLDLTVYLAGHMHVPEAEILTVRYRGRVHHAIAVWSTELLPALRHAVHEEGTRGIERFAAAHETAVFDWPRRRGDPFLNINTPADWMRAEVLASRGA
ncbi:MAG: molybdenum cofactor guanylyltransferase [Alphaproteobacteria bacterium]|nr:molybdenum cofactor guanylyltransferase [Alphaproteobacteria bacterium]